MVLFQKNEQSDIPIWLQLKNRIVYLIESGGLKPGDKLPTVRSMSVEACINANTVLKAYSALEQEGYVETGVGRGTFVAQQGLVGLMHEEHTLQAMETLTADYVAAAQELGLSLKDIEVYLGKYLRMDGLSSETSSQLTQAESGQGKATRIGAVIQFPSAAVAAER